MQFTINPTAPAAVPFKPVRQLSSGGAVAVGTSPLPPRFDRDDLESGEVLNLDPVVSLWLSHFKKWRDGFVQKIAPDVKKYWRGWRNYNDFQILGPQAAWRDQSVYATLFRIISTRTPRVVLSIFGQPDFFSVEGRDQRNEGYEDLVKNTLEQALDQVGFDDPDGMTFLARITEAMIYAQVCGHVWFKAFHRESYSNFLGQIKNQEGIWEKVSNPERTYFGPDLVWLGMGDLAVPLKGPRRWAIERVGTTINTLVHENRVYAKIHGRDLYPGLSQLESKLQSGPPGPSPETNNLEEAERSEQWPLSEDDLDLPVGGDDREVELWLCWDNLARTLTKIADRTVILDSGLSPTPLGNDPYFSFKAVPIPKRVYGDSILRWVYDQSVANTRLRRARMDEAIISLFQQFFYRVGSITNPKLLLKPGGAIGIRTPDPTADINRNFGVIPRRPIFSEAYVEAQALENEAFSTAAADYLGQGDQATQKARDVTAYEVDRRGANANLRYQLDDVWRDSTFTHQLLYRFFDLLRQNLTEPWIVDVGGVPTPVTLQQISNPVKIKIAGGMFQTTPAEKQRKVQNLVALAGNERFGPVFNPQEILKEALKVDGWKNPSRFLLTPSQVTQERQDVLAEQTLAEGQGASPTASSNSLLSSLLAGGLAPEGVVPLAGQGSLPPAEAGGSLGELL
jgi:hypothetical protein